MNELDKLRRMLTDAGIPFESIQEKGQHGFAELGRENYGKNGEWLRNQIIYGNGASNSKWSWKLDGVCQFGSYGVEQGLIETYGELGVDANDEPMVLTAEEVFAIIANDYFGKGVS